MTPMPGRLAVAAVASILDDRRRQLARRQGHGADKPGREGTADRLAVQVRTLGTLLQGRRSLAPLDPAVVGRLCAWAAGDLGQARLLEDDLDAADRADLADRVNRSEDVAAAVAALVGE